MTADATQRLESDDAFSVDTLESMIGFNLRTAQAKIFEDLGRRLKRMQLRPAEYSVLTLIKRNPGCYASQVAEVLSIKLPNFVVLLAALEERNLVKRKRSIGDKRVFHLELTQYGGAFLKEADLLACVHEEQIMNLLGNAGKTDLINLLKRLQNLAVAD